MNRVSILTFIKKAKRLFAITTFALGCTVGLVYFIMDMKSVGYMIKSGLPADFAGLVSDPVHGLGLPFMLVGPIICAFCFATYIATSLASPPPPAHQLENACWGSPLKALHGRITGIGDPRVISIILCLLMIVLYAFLR